MIDYDQSFNPNLLEAVMTHQTDHNDSTDTVLEEPNLMSSCKLSALRTSKMLQEGPPKKKLLNGLMWTHDFLIDGKREEDHMSLDAAVALLLSSSRNSTPHASFHSELLSTARSV